MKNPYFIGDENAVLSFSGGRSSGYMLYQTIQAHGGNLPENIKVIFCNTGKEFTQCLDFVEACSQQWGVKIHWLEYTGKKSFKEVDYGSASREGEPFTQLITGRKALPNSMMRFCTGELKVLTIDRFCKSIGFDDYSTIIGMRADEPRRVAKMRGKEGYIVPMASAGVTEQDIFTFWGSHSFDLELPNGTSNCDLCFLKGLKIKASLIREGVSPQWWIDQELRTGRTFRNDQPSYADMSQYDDEQYSFFDDAPMSCFCGD